MINYLNTIISWPLPYLDPVTALLKSVISSAGILKVIHNHNTVIISYECTELQLVQITDGYMH